MAKEKIFEKGAITKEKADIMRKVLEEKRKYSEETYEKRMKEQLRGFKRLKS